MNRGLSALGGVAASLVGVALTLSVAASLALVLLLVVAGFVLLGAGSLLEARLARSESRPSTPDVLAAAVWFVAAAAVLVWPGTTVRAVAVVVGLALVVTGSLRVWETTRARADGWVAHASLGLAAVLLGLVALAWPDVTVFVVAVVFGVRVLWFGLTLLARAVTGRRAAKVVEPSRARRAGRNVASVLALAAAVVLAVVSVGLRSAEPRPDDFYEPPVGIGELDASPGEVLRVEPFTRDVPADAQAWRVLYATTVADDEPAVASALVVVPRGPDGEPPAQPPRVVLWHHGTTGVTQGCAPSVLDDVWGSGAFFLLDDVLERGWALVAPDYVGLGTPGPHPYLVGNPTARSALDAARAAQQLEQVDLAEATVAWGHSQGGGAALWSGVLAPSYAPELELVGVAALAPASNLPGLVTNLGAIPGGNIFAAYVVNGYVTSYPDVRIGDVVAPQAQTLVQELSGRCLAERSVVVSLLETLVVRDTLIRADALDGPFGQRLADNVPSADIDAPLFVGQGAADSLVLPTAQREYVAARCAAGQQVDYREYEGRDHVPLVETDSPLVPDLLAWTEDRFAGEPATSTCP